MTECDLISTCLFFNDKVPDMPTTANYLKEKYCQGTFADCCRYRIYRRHGRNNVPRGLFPNDDEEYSMTLLKLQRSNN
jgi:hypothetical protein